MKTTSSCPDTDLIRQLARGRVSAVAEAHLDRHLAVCPPCAERHDEFFAPVVRAVRRVAVGADLPDADVLIDRVRGLRSMPPTPPASVSTGGDAADAGSQTVVSPNRSTTELPTYQDDSPHRIGKFVIRGKLGSGGMGDVFRAEDESLNREVALKLLQTPGGVRPTSAERHRLIAEAKAAARVEHPNIVRVYEVGESEGVPYLAMELLRGETLADRLRREKRLPAAEVCRLGAQIAEGLAAAHAAKLVHRDIKPSNLWLEPGKGGPVVRILDFGLAREGVLETTSGASVVHRTGLAGTPAYMSPEQAAGLELDARSDLFSLGAVLYEMTAGRRLIVGARTTDVLAAVRNYAAPAAGSLLPGVPSPLAAVIAGMVVNDRDRRAVSSARFAADRLSALSVRFTRPRLLTWAVAAGVSAVAVVLLAQIVVRIRRDERDPGVELTVVPGTKVGVAADGTTTLTLPPPGAPIPPDYTGPTLDHLKRADIPPEFLDVASGGGPVVLPPEVVGFVGHPLEDRSNPDAGHGGPVTGMALHPDGTTLFTAGHDAVVRIWSLSHPQPAPAGVLPHPDQLLTCLALSPSGDRLVTADTAGLMTAWDLTRREKRQTYAAKQYVSALAYSADGKRIAAGLEASVAGLYRAGTLTPDGEMAVGRGQVLSVRFLPNRNTLIAGGRGYIRGFDHDKGIEVLHQAENKAVFTSIVVSGDGRWLGTQGGVVPLKPNSVLSFLPIDREGAKTRENMYSVRAVDAAFSVRASFEHPDREVNGKRVRDRVMHAAFSPDGSRLATVTQGNRVSVWDRVAERLVWTAILPVPSWSKILENEVSPTIAGPLTYHPDGRHILVAMGEGYVLIVRPPREPAPQPTGARP